MGKTLELLEQNNRTNDTVVVNVSEQSTAFPFAKWSGLQSARIVRWPREVLSTS